MSPQVIGYSGLFVWAATHSAVDVLPTPGIINKIQESRDPKHMTSFKAFILKCYRKAEDNRGVIEAILSMLPTGSYASVISRGFTLILTVSFTFPSQYQNNNFNSTET